MNRTTPQTAEQMVAALKASIAANEAKKAVGRFAAKLAALDALIASQRPVPKTIRVVAKEVSDFGDAKCGCCGRPHRKMHRMSNGVVMGSRCADLVERLTGLGGEQAARFLRMSHPTSPALRFAEVTP
jgi:hypothetical protein